MDTFYVHEFHGKDFLINFMDTYCTWEAFLGSNPPAPLSEASVSHGFAQWLSPALGLQT